MSNCCHQDSHYHGASGSTWTSEFLRVVQSGWGVGGAWGALGGGGSQESSKVSEGHAGASGEPPLKPPPPPPSQVPTQQIIASFSLEI